MSAVTWLGIGLAILLSGPRSPAPSVGSEAGPRRAAALAPLGVVLAGVAVGGWAGLVAAGILAPGAGWAAGRLVRRRSATARRDPALPLVLDLTAAALEAGLPPPRALELAAAAGAPATADELRRVARYLALGADMEQAWRDVSPSLAPVAAAARRSARSGARIAQTLTDLATETRSAERAAALARAQRAGVLALLPLGLCFLPAFVCLGIVPSVAGLLGGVLARP